MTRLSLSLFLLALFFCGVALVTLNKVETIVTILTVIVAGMCVLAGWAHLERERVAIFFAAMRRVWLSLAYCIATTASFACIAWLAAHDADGASITAWAVVATLCCAGFEIRARRVMRAYQRTYGTLDSLIVEFSNDIPDKIEFPHFVAPNSSLPKPEIHQRTSDITPSPHVSDVGEVRKQRSQRLDDIRRMAERKGYGR